MSFGLARSGVPAHGRTASFLTLVPGVGGGISMGVSGLCADCGVGGCEMVVPSLEPGDNFDRGEPNSLHSLSGLGPGQQQAPGGQA